MLCFKFSVYRFIGADGGIRRLRAGKSARGHSENADIDDFGLWHISSNWWWRINDCFTSESRRAATGTRMTAVGQQYRSEMLRAMSQ